MDWLVCEHVMAGEEPVAVDRFSEVDRSSAGGGIAGVFSDCGRIAGVIVCAFHYHGGDSMQRVSDDEARRRGWLAAA